MRFLAAANHAMFDDDPREMRVDNPDNIEYDVLRVADMVRNLNSENREKVLALVCQLAMERGGYNHFNQPSAHTYQRATPFRFMDLSAELRLYIGEYTLLSETPLCWMWKSYQATSNRNIGSFKGLEKLTALTRVSRQLRTELAGIVWGLNEFCFDEQQFGQAFRGSVSGMSSVYRQPIPKAHGLFLCKLSSSSQGCLRYITINVDAQLSILHGGPFIINWITEMASKTPGARFRVELSAWTFRAYIPGPLSPMFSVPIIEFAIKKFINNGQILMDRLSALGLNVSNRNWQLFPSRRQDYREFERYLDDSNRQMVLDWHTKGI
ncbi:hypothetical protein HBH56_004340 [Parastagonospora nodorum]|uniref:Uncharacterized protein n=2 Tax=Phaeosphaeria nodorum (strain SN15 / ATCC MYA-4574 / FGSC 10173) TaxID=321614 RepID=A0A7U2ENZ1_PHANO|nr:hypothetical protein SNOG_09737 [Parastagonospora nodorum SN15]KAH3920427.1 hypothetical protein HBH56_004340 [Parastagonospora nodorum]EAT83002.1 hypothetical protein SNOG_09737 [Parastagonospora nodorum SN15]KAH3938136.1 hypothetical protein HBH54_004330 [Parastagonospora nodorum]KAH4145459.1 hypothetical protein HBH45_008070 [Parastagonospora nodorum]KAH4164525.1 hypothetical protein HBH44_076300 [Parastagonospora nodorum]